MRTARILFILGWCWLGTGMALAAAASAGGETRLAIWSPDAALQPAADVLTAALSREGKVALVERNELNRIATEQHLAAGDFLKVGRLTGADGVCVLERVNTGTTNRFVTRIVAVKPGVVLFMTSQAWPVADLAGWQQLVATRVARLKPKFAVPVKEAVPVSLLNIRASLPGADTAEQERLLTSMLLERLTAQPELFVLERRQLDQLAWEKQLLGADAPFWTGAYLIDGTIDRDGIQPGRMTVDLRVQPPGAGAALTVQAAGARSKPLAIVEQLTTELLKTLKVRNVATWNPSAEAAGYLTEAGWALKWSMFHEAQSAAESAWALGLQTTDAATLRVRCYLAEAGNWNLQSVPTAAELAAGIRSLELLAFQMDNTDWRNAKDARTWADLGAESLKLCSRLLTRAQYDPRATVELTASLAQVRKLCREVNLRLRSHESEALPIPARGDLEFTFGSLWQENHQASLEMYRRMVGTRVIRVSPSGEANIDGRAIAEHLPDEWLRGWTRDDRLLRNQAWYGFLDEVCRSTNSLVRLEGWYMRCLRPVPVDDPTNNFAQLLQACRDNQRLIFASSSRLASIDSLAYTMAQYSPARILSAAQKEQLQSMRTALQPGLTKYVAEQQGAVTREFLDYLQHATTFDNQKFSTLSSDARKAATGDEFITIYEALMKFPERFPTSQAIKDAMFHQEFAWRVKLPAEYRADLAQKNKGANEQERLTRVNVIRRALQPGKKADQKQWGLLPEFTFAESRELQTLLADYQKRGGDMAAVQRLDERVKANLTPVSELKSFLANSRNHDSSKFQKLFEARDFTAVEARELIQPMKDYLQRAVSTQRDKVVISNTLKRLREITEANP